MIEKSGYSEVFTGDEHGCEASYEGIKNSLEQKMSDESRYYYRPALWYEKRYPNFS